MQTVIIALVGLAAIVSAVPTQQLSTADFAKILEEGSRGCQRSVQTRFDQLQCAPARTVNDIYKQIPGNRETVRRYATGDFMRTLDLCAEREGGNASDWNKMTANRLKLGAEANGPVWQDCNAQITKEKVDCKNAKNLLCAFKQGTHFRCMDLNQFKRTTKTLEISGDQCNVIEAVGDGRPTDAKEFNARTTESFRGGGCITRKDETDVKCFAETTVQAIMSRFPTGINPRTNAAVQPGLQQTIDSCLKEQTLGFPRLRVKANQVYKAGKERDECVKQITQDEKNCKKATAMLCQHSYGIDLRCLDQDNDIKKRTAIRVDQCQDAVNALRIEQGL
jgi:hypothetical protein